MSNLSNLPNSFNTPLFPTWCPGCGDFGIWSSIKQTLTKLSLPTYQVLIVYGIGCSGNMSNFINCYGFHSLHGRAIPNAAGAKLANHKLSIIVAAGDGDLLGEGLSHFIHGARANHDITVILHNNQIYGLTTGQASPTSFKGAKTKSTPSGVIDEPINPSILAISQQAGFVARCFAADINQTSFLIGEGVKHPGFSLIEVLQPCVTFNKINTYEWFRQRVKKLETSASDILTGIKLAQWTDETINIGILYKNSRPAFHQQIPLLKKGTLLEATGTKRDISKLLATLT